MTKERTKKRPDVSRRSKKVPQSNWALSGGKKNLKSHQLRVRLQCTWVRFAHKEGDSGKSCSGPPSARVPIHEVPRKRRNVKVRAGGIERRSRSEPAQDFEGKKKRDLGRNVFQKQKRSSKNRRATPEEGSGDTQLLASAIQQTGGT